MKKTLTAILASTLFLFVTGCGHKQKQEEPAVAKTPARELIERLQAQAESGKILFGHQDDPVYGHSWKWEQGRSDVKDLTGHYPAIMGWDLGRLELGDTVNLDGVPFERMRREVIAQDARGGINTFSWHPYSPVDNYDSWNISDTTTVSRMVSDPKVNREYRRQLRRLAHFINGLMDPDGNKIAVIFRPWHENTGSWFWWGDKNCSDADYHALWTQMREEFDAAGVDNVVWAYSPGTSTAQEYMKRYPGDDIIDIFGTDIYHYPYDGDMRTDAYRRDVMQGLETCTTEAARRGKIAAFSETGLEGVVMDDWFTNVLAPLMKQHKIAYVLCWRNAHDKPGHHYVPYEGHPAADDFRAFANDSTFVFI